MTRRAAVSRSWRRAPSSHRGCDMGPSSWKRLELGSLGGARTSRPPSERSEGVCSSLAGQSQPARPRPAATSRPTPPQPCLAVLLAHCLACVSQDSESAARPVPFLPQLLSLPTPPPPTPSHTSLDTTPSVHPPSTASRAPSSIPLHSLLLPRAFLSASFLPPSTAPSLLRSCVDRLPGLSFFAVPAHHRRRSTDTYFYPRLLTSHFNVWTLRAGLTHLHYTFDTHVRS